MSRHKISSTLVLFVVLALAVGCAAPPVDTSAIDAAKSAAATADAKLVQAEAAVAAAATAQAAGGAEVASAQATTVAAQAAVKAAQATADAAQALLTAPTPAPEPTKAAPALPISRIRAGVNGNIITLDPAATHQVASFWAMNLTGGHLFKWAPNHDPIPELVDTWELSSDSLVYTMKLKKDLKFSDGSPLTSEDVLFNWERVKASTSTNKALILTVKSVEAPDAQTLVWTHAAPNPDFLQWFGYEYLTIHPKSKLEADTKYWDHPITSGMYRVKQYVPNSPSAVFEANPFYALGEPAIKEVELVFVADLTSRVLQLTTGQLDFVQDLPPSAQNSFPTEVRLPGANPLGGTYSVVINLAAADNPLLNPDVRHAISLAIDRDLISKKAFYGISPPVQGLLYAGRPESPSVLANGGKRDLAAAKELLAKTPYAAGFAFTLQTWGSRPGWTDACLIIKENLAELGITVTVQPLEDSVALDNLRSGNFVAQWTGAIGFPTAAFYGAWFTSLYADWCNYKNPAIVELLGKATSETDIAARTKLYNEIEALFYTDLPYIPISERVEFPGTRLAKDYFGMVKFSQYPYALTLADAQALLAK